MERHDRCRVGTPGGAVLAVAVLCLPALAQDTQPAEIEVVNPEHGFRFKIPASFEPMPALSAGGVLHGYMLTDGPSPAGSAPTMVMIQRMPPGGSLEGMANIRVPKALLPGGSEFRTETRTWQGREVPAVSMTMSRKGLGTRSVMVEIPLRPRPIMVTVMGDAARKDEMEGYLRGILDSLQGQAAGPIAVKGPVGGSAPMVFVPLAAVAALGLIVSVVVVVVLLVARSKRKRPAPLTPVDPN